jgi:hypothetical protein
MVRRASLLLALVTILLQLASAQTQAINGSIRGRITDPAGAAVPGANISAVNGATGFTRAIDSNDEGYYVLANLPIGVYVVTIKKEGFDSQRRPDIRLDAGTEAVIDASMKVGAVTTTIEVSGGAPVVEPSRVNTGRTIGHEEVDNLPLTSRNPYNFIIFQPGVSGHPNAELGIPRTINTNGLLDRINYQMDGMVNTESDRYGLRLFPISDIYVQEVQTVSNSFAPEFGNTAGNIYNVITNSGTNQFHGEFYFIGRPPDASSRTILLASNRVAPAIDLHDYAMNSGGAIKKDKLFIFGGYEHLLRALPSPNTIPIATAQSAGIAASLLETAPSVQHVQFLNLRADWIVNDKNSVFFRYNYFRNEYPFNTAVGGINALDVGEDFHDRAHIGGLQWLTTFTPTALNEFRASDPYRNEAHAPNPIAGPGPRITISGVATFNGYGPGFPGDHFAEKIPSFSDNFTLIRGAHTYKMGMGWQQNNDNQLNAPTYNIYTFATVANYLAAKNNTACPTSGLAPGLCYSTYQTNVGLAGASYKSYFYDLYVQDSWQIRPNLLAIYGVRWDRYQAPDGEANAPFAYTRSFRTPGANFSPRLGLAWTINPKTVVRANGGIFYEATPTNLWFNSLVNDGIRSFTATFTPTTANAPVFPTQLSNVIGVSAGTPSITTVTPNFKNAYTINAGLQITRQITQNDSLMVGFVHTGARNLTYLRDMNLINPISFLADGRPVYGAASATTRLFPQFNGITLQDIGAVSDYEALVVQWTHRMSHGISLSANYTWSHTISDAPDANSFEQNLPIEDPTNRRRDRGNSIVNRPSAFNTSIVIAPVFKMENHIANMLANGNQITLLANLSSGDQNNITTGTLLNGDPIGGSVQRPLYVGRDTVRTPAIYQFDGRYTRVIFGYRERIKIKLLAEVNNIFNRHSNYNVLNTTAAVNALGVITTAPSLLPQTGGANLEGRLIQLGIRADW